MQGLHPVYVYPGFDPDTQLNTEIFADDIRRALETHPHIRAAVIVSPTYDGIVSDVESIAEAVHVHDIPLIVDEDVYKRQKRGDSMKKIIRCGCLK